MEDRLSLDEFERCADAYDRAVDQAPEIDRFCSRSEWILPFHLAFLPERELHLYRRGDSFVALAAREDPSVGRYLEPLENMWCFACPLVGPDAAELLSDVLARLSEPRHPIPVVLSGVPLAETMLRPLSQRLARRYEIRAVDSTLRFVASLEGGLDGFLSRRPASLRRNLRAAERRAQRAGVVFRSLDLDSAAALASSGAFERILAVERRSWKATQGTGVDSGVMLVFYRNMLPRLAARSGLRVLIASIGDRDVGYLHGGVVGDHFRGLQISFDHEFRHLSLGNLLQQEMIRGLSGEGIRTYDLGAHSAYKRRWAEDGLETVTLVLRRP